MKLIDYLRDQKISDEEFAAKIGRSKHGVRKWMYGQRLPRPAELAAIRTITGGKVTLDDFLPAPASPRPSPVQEETT